MRDVIEAATESAGKLIDRQQLLGWFVVIGSVLMIFVFGVAIYLGFELIEFHKKELQNERVFKKNLVDINQRVFALNQRSVTAIERNTLATESLVAIAQTNASVWRHLLVESKRATEETRRAAEAILQTSPEE